MFAFKPFVVVVVHLAVANLQMLVPRRFPLQCDLSPEHTVKSCSQGVCVVNVLHGEGYHACELTCLRT